MKICDICHKTVEQLQGGPKGLETLDCCRVCLDDLHRRIQALDQNLRQQREQQWDLMLQDWRKSRAPEPSPESQPVVSAP